MIKTNFKVAIFSSIAYLSFAVSSFAKFDPTCSSQSQKYKNIEQDLTQTIFPKVKLNFPDQEGLVKNCYETQTFYPVSGSSSISGNVEVVENCVMPSDKMRKPGNKKFQFNVIGQAYEKSQSGEKLSAATTVHECWHTQEGTSLKYINLWIRIMEDPNLINNKDFQKDIADLITKTKDNALQISSKLQYFLDSIPDTEKDETMKFKIKNDIGNYVKRVTESYKNDKAVATDRIFTIIGQTQEILPTLYATEKYNRTKYPQILVQYSKFSDFLQNDIYKNIDEILKKYPNSTKKDKAKAKK
jgi:hypothetical protein